MLRRQTDMASIHVTYLTGYREPTHSIVVIWVNIFQTELMVEIYSNSLGIGASINYVRT